MKTCQRNLGQVRTILGDGTPVQSFIATGHLLREAIYPPQEYDQTTSRTVHSAYNALSEQTWTKNQNGTVITTTLDIGGRETARIVDYVDNGSAGVSGWAKRIGLSYTDRGQVEGVTQYSDTAGTTALNGVKYTYDDWGNITKIEQDRDSAVGSGTPYAVEFAYSLKKAVSGRERVQRDSMKLPYPSTGYTVEYTYEGGDTSPTGLDYLAGRVTGLHLNGSGSKRVAYQYLGAGDLVGTTYPELTGVASYRHDNQSNAAYDAFDRFNRIVIDRWNASGGTPYRLNLTYDWNSNITLAEDPVIINGSDGGSPATVYRPYTSKYEMDGLNRVKKADRGRPDGSGGVTGATRLNELWTLTQTGNWKDSNRQINDDADVTDASTPGVWSIPEFDEDRKHNTVNEVLERAVTGAIVSGTPTTYTAKHDLAGQLIDDGKNRGFQYDAFGRLVEVRKVTSRNGSGVITAYTVMAEYRYDGLGQRIAWHQDFDQDGTAESSEKWTHIVYDDRWRMVALFHADDPVTEPKELLVPHNAGFDGRGGSSYIDSYAVSEFDGYAATSQFANTSDGVLQTRRYYLQNWRADVVSLMETDGNFMAWYKYSAYGQHQRIAIGDVDNWYGNGFRDGGVDGGDMSAFLTYFENGDARADMNGDGGVDINDNLLWLASFYSGGAVPESRIMYAGYAFDALDDPYSGQLGIYHVRHRVYSPELGRWTRRDPLGYVDSTSLFECVASKCVVATDPSGLAGILGYDQNYDKGAFYEYTFLCKGRLFTMSGWLRVDQLKKRLEAIKKSGCCLTWLKVGTHHSMPAGPQEDGEYGPCFDGALYSCEDGSDGVSDTEFASSILLCQGAMVDIDACNSLNVAIAIANANRGIQFTIQVTNGRNAHDDITDIEFTWIDPAGFNQVCEFGPPSKQPGVDGDKKDCSNPGPVISEPLDLKAPQQEPRRPSSRFNPRE